MRFIHSYPLRWSDVDVFGHVNNVEVVRLYEEARVLMLFAMAGGFGVQSLEAGLVTARHEIDYLRPVEYRIDRTPSPEQPAVRIEMWVGELKNSRFTIAYELFDGDTLLGRGSTICVPFSVDLRRPRWLTENELDFLGTYLLTENVSDKP